MMIKGCMNPDCNSFLKQVKYKDKKLEVCPECGQQLEHVCKTCPTVVNDEKRVYCLRCEQEKKEKNAKLLAGAKKVGGAVATVAVTVVGTVIGIKKK